MAKLTVIEMKAMVGIAAKHITAGKDKEAVIKLLTKTLMAEGVTSFDFFSLKSFDDSLEARIINLVYKLMCGAEAHAHKVQMAKIAKAGKVSPATAAQRAQFLHNEQVRIFNEQVMINNIHNNF